MVTARRPEPDVLEVPVARPVMRGGKPSCPRCGNRLQRDYETLTCVACGYEFAPAPGDPEWRSLTMRRAALALPFMLVRGVNPWVTVAALAVVAIAPTVVSALRRRSREEGTR